MLKTSILNANEFLGLFYSPEIDAYELTNKTKISLYILRIDGGWFDYESLKRELGNAAVTYVFSRTRFENVEKGKLHECVKQVQESFRDATVNEGEGGELFLYCFLETHLKAPKILSKMELKTAGNDYVKGADGIHLLDLGDGHYHLIFGESKMVSDSTQKGSSFRKAIADAFKSIKKLEANGIGNEIQLIDSNLLKESFSDDVVEYIKRIIKPSALDTTVTKANAFGIFVGFEIDINDRDLQQLSDADFEVQIKSTVKKAVEEKSDYIKEQIQQNDLSGYHFYIYAVPFIKKGAVNIDVTRKQIIEHIQ